MEGKSSTDINVASELEDIDNRRFPLAEVSLTLVYKGDILIATAIVVSCNSALIVCDIQEGFRSSILSFPELLQAAGFLRKSAKLLGVPTLFSEQWPEEYGHTGENNNSFLE
ncbi:uncharacterized protein Gasu_39860 [Galdieria sulphuraria]|uniref:Uncharacterized protein n=1 Tax=Galdieria sulphuraria TaxID=130081 RepID=M2VZ59_GALSU|nr:uncharacterized protein Gasu_39860 [Galdieria sulphuraria]EME28611.1 hypothetical protein Gasu_39860 [Galdieria sulphuraria]|eukprot:XP_005705131.1 hypothetical protein Gasu_39860 [Galdieria sulphuraria]